MQFYREVVEIKGELQTKLFSSFPNVPNNKFLLVDFF